MTLVPFAAVPLVVASLIGVAFAQAPATLQSAVAAMTSKDGDIAPQFKHALSDLDGDGIDDAIVLLTGPTWCGSGGCTLAVFRGTKDGFAFVSRSTVTREPVRVSPLVSHGWKVLVVNTKGKGDVLLRFDGKRYPGSPSAQGKASAAQAKAARTVIQ